MDGFADWFYQADGSDKPRMVNFFDEMMSEHMILLEGVFQICYKAGYEAGWNDREQINQGLDS
jgi:hypothetical protein